MPRKPLIAANWKMHKTPAESASFVEAFLPLVASDTRSDIVLCPPAISLSVVADALVGSNVAAGAQNMHYAEEGAFTGETSPSMIVAVGATYVILGHSERRQYFNETDESVNKKLHTALRHKLLPIVCVGELLSQRESGSTEDVLVRQVSGALADITPEQAETLAIAYEPVWAIGTGKTATPEMAAAAHLLIRSEVARLLSRDIADNLRILYGGSVKPDNASSLLNQPEIDGALVGGASLKPDSFAQIVKY
jgi:triosephosphate isomerase